MRQRLSGGQKWFLEPYFPLIRGMLVFRSGLRFSFRFGHFQCPRRKSKTYQKCLFLKTILWLDFDLLESNSIYIFVHANQKIYHSTFFFSWCMFCTLVWCLLLQSNMWTYDIWRRDLTVFDRVLHLKEILSKMCSFRCCLLLPIIAGEVRALRADWARIRFCQRWQNTEPRMGDARLDPFGRSHANSADLLCPLLQNIC